MRQAGRYMEPYRKLRARHSLLELCLTPELAVEVTLQPIAALDVDAAILFSDLLLPLAPLGLPFHFAAGEGPVVEKPLRTPADIDALHPFEPREALAAPLEAIRLLRRELKVPLIGFGGAPFTLASYAIEGGHSRSFARTKELMYREPRAWGRLMDTLAAVVSEYLVAQVEAGVEALQVFDSWVGHLGGEDYAAYVAPHLRPLFERLQGLGVPVIHFGTGTGHLLRAQRDAGGDVIGVDWRTPLGEARRLLGDGVAIQGNLDPCLLLAPREHLLQAVAGVLAQAGTGPGHIFNLGHGILPETPVENVRAVVEHVRTLTAK
jgi:uroporphyrinogen decarboxylase